MRRLLIVLAFALLVPAAAAQGAIRLGPDLSRPLPSGGFHLAAKGCQAAAQYNPCTYLTVASANPDVTAAAPFDGVITSWSFRAGCCLEANDVAHHLTLKTYRFDGFTPYAAATPHLEGPTFEIPPGGVLPADPAATLPARLPIAKGELVAVSADHPIDFALDDTIPGITYTILFNGYAYGSAFTDAALMLSAVVEPDVDGDGFGDETQDCKPADPATHDVDCAPPPPATHVDPISVGIICAPSCPAGSNGSGGGGGGGGGGTTSASVPIIPPGAPGAGAIPPPSDPNSVYISLSCPPGVTQPCGGYLILVPGGAKKAAAASRTRYAIAPGKSKQVKVPLSAKLRQTLKRKGRLAVKLRLQPDGGAKATTFTRTIKLKHKPARKR